jgi:hypothetical protein
MSSYRRRSHESSPTSPDVAFAVPFKDAHPDSDEAPLADIDQFIIPGRDDHGGHQTVAISCPPLLVHQVDVAVRTNLFPYINREAFVRHAVVRHLRWLQSIRPNSMDQHMSPAIEAILERCFEAQMQKKVKGAFDALRETILRCEADGEHMEVVRLVNYVKIRLEYVGAGSVWQRRSWKRFLADFSGYLWGPDSEPIKEPRPVVERVVRRLNNEVSNEDTDEVVN